MKVMYDKQDYVQILDGKLSIKLGEFMIYVMEASQIDNLTVLKEMYNEKKSGS